MSSVSFIHLRVHSAYSLLEGAIPVKDLVKWSAKQHMPAVAIADFGNLFGSLEFALAAADNGVQPIHACILYFLPTEERGSSTVNRKPDQLLVCVQNETGWKNLLKLVSKSFLDPVNGEPRLLRYEELEGKTDGLIALASGIYGGIGRHLLDGRTAQATELLERLKSLFPTRLYIELMRHDMPEEIRLEPLLIEQALAHNLPLVATNDAYFIDKGMYEAHDAFLCIADGAYVGEDQRRRLTPHHRLKTPQEMCALFADIPEALENTVRIAQRCSYYTSSRPPMLPRFEISPSPLRGEGLGGGDASSAAAEHGEGLSEAEIMREQARAGLEQRLIAHVFKEGMDDAAKIEIAKPYRERLEFEIDTIIKMQFPGYFLIVSDFIKWSKAHDIPVGPGRGSGAGSLVAWALYITDLDPLRYGLLFERFLNPQRVSMPDFDVDFCQDRRDEVITYVQQRYGRERVAQIITFGKLMARAVLRDVGRVLQMPYGQVDRICKLVPANPANPVSLGDAIGMEPALKAAMREDETVEKLVEISLKLEGLNRHASTHAAGVVIADRPLDELVPLYRDPKSDMPVVQYSMKYAESAGLVKFDFLGLKTLSVLSTCVKMVAQKGEKLDLLLLPEGDPAAYGMLSRGETIGVFQLEGAGMRDTVKKLRPDRLEDIIALVSLYRPGPMDNIPTYIARKHGEEEPDYLHPLLAPILRETYGVIIYQEQVMQIAQVLAGYSLGEADLLRRAMGKKIRAEMEAQREIFVSKAVGQGVVKSQAATIFDLIAKFAEYGFNKSHAAAYALVAYQTAYLKANHTVEFIASSMIYDMHNTEKLGIFREDAARYGIQLLTPDINKSDVLFTVEYASSPLPLAGGEGGGNVSSAVDERQDSPLNPPASGGNGQRGNIRYALAAIRNVGEQAMQAVVDERKANGPFKDIFDFAVRVPSGAINKRAVEFLIKSGAFDSLHPNRAQIFNALDLIMAHGDMVQREKASDQENLFGMLGGGKEIIKAPQLPPCNDWPSLEKLHHEFGAIGFYLSSHPLESYHNALKRLGVISSSRFAERLGEKYTSIRIAGIVTARKFKVSDKGRFAFVQLSDTGGVYEISIFDEELLNKHRDKLEVGQVLYIQADGKMEESGPRLIAQGLNNLDEEMRRMPASANPGRLRIVLTENGDIPVLRQYLGEANGHGMPIIVAARIQQGRCAEITLPGRYNVTPATLDRIRALKSIVSAEEI